MTDITTRRIEENPISKMNCVLDQLARHPDPAVRRQGKRLRHDLNDLLNRSGRALQVSMAQTEMVIRKYDELQEAMVEITPRLPDLVAMVVGAEDDVVELTG